MIEVLDVDVLYRSERNQSPSAIASDAPCSIRLTRTMNLSAQCGLLVVRAWSAKTSPSRRRRRRYLFSIYSRLYTSIYLVYTNYNQSHNIFSWGRRHQRRAEGERSVAETRSSSRRPAWTETRAMMSLMQMMTWTILLFLLMLNFNHSYSYFAHSLNVYATSNVESYINLTLYSTFVCNVNSRYL